MTGLGIAGLMCFAGLAACAPAVRAQPVVPASASVAPQEGVRWIGRWVLSGHARVATYAGSQVEFHFEHSTTVAVDLRVSDSRGGEPLVVSVSIDGGKAVRLHLSRGGHPRVVLARGLSDGAHRVAVRKEGEPYFGALQVANPSLDVAGRWLSDVDDRPVIEVIGDSDATGICALGPDGPADAVSIWNSGWAAESLSWVGLLEAGLRAVGHPADVVNLAISGSKTAAEAESYDLTAPGYSEARFGGYSPPGRAHASLVFLWGGGNDRHGGGDVARTSGGAGALTYGDLSAFQQGVHDQLTKIFARNPDAKVVLLEYTDPAIPDWTPAYDQVVGMLPEPQRLRILRLRVYDPKGGQGACEADPRGHPNLYLHSAWAAQVLAWMMSDTIFPQLGIPAGQHWIEP